MTLTKDSWTEPDYIEFKNYLRLQADEKYRDFYKALVPNSADGEILGVRVPILRQIGKEIAKGNAAEFMQISKPDCYEERMVRGVVLSLMKSNSFEDFVGKCDKFSSEINNWAVCDCFCSGLKEVKKYKAQFFEHLPVYLKSENNWKIRFALVIMLDYYLDDEYIDRVLSLCDSIKSDYYYVEMAQAWLVATAMAKCKDKTMKYLLDSTLSNEVFNKAIQKCVESRRIDDDTKVYLKSLKRH